MDTADDVMPFVTAAIDAYGTGVLAKTSELAADTEVARGSRILQRVFGRGDERAHGVIGRVAGAKPDDESGRAALRSAIMEEFRADPLLRREVAAMLARVTVTGERPVAVGGEHLAESGH
ncbi:hypothetical protein HCN51_03690 [Nonomuraea sp. FMUSA5-5]|uniref:DUF222 domain-containing protein n=1 Tax=Nonomuraea composti TaxID=2720023 RepID=A0ABX1AWK3_9ACTN|nr:hypothetical protein [Nonomuraea sp. FMUSA5-5]NJP88567.1 hypothetical protein [Nonomuraea sp. FMUSA5-5]